MVIGFTDAAAGTGTYVEWKIRLDVHRTRIEALTHETLASIEWRKYSTTEDSPRDVRGLDDVCHVSTVAAEKAAGNQGTMYECEILLRPDTEGGAANSWPKYQIKLSYPSTLEFTPIDSVNLPSISDKLSPCSSVYETSLGGSTLQIVTAQTTLHISVTSESERMFLIAVLREAIRASSADSTDTLFSHAILRADEDEVYSVDVQHKESMGLGFKRVGEWMVVNKSAHEHTTGVTVGSILCAINGDDVLLRSYRDTMSQMRQTNPPLTLSFRRCPRKQGDLLKMSKGPEGDVIWKRRTFLLSSDSLTYYPQERAGIHTHSLKHAVDSKYINLIGARVKLLDPPYLLAEEKRCFVLTSGLATITVQCNTYKQVGLPIRYTYISSLLLIIIRISRLCSKDTRLGGRCVPCHRSC